MARQPTPEEEEARQQGLMAGYDARDEEQADESLMEDEARPKEQAMIFHSFSKPTKFKRSTFKKRLTPSVGTTFYPKAMPNPFTELYHKINRLKVLLESFFSRMKNPEKPNDLEPRFKAWSREVWYGWINEQEAFNENIITQINSMETDSFSRRSEDGQFLKEITAARKYLERKNEPIKDMTRR